MEQILSQRGKEKFSHNGYLFIFDKFSKTKGDLMFWRCEQLSRCKARIHTRFGNVVKFINTHTHDSSPIRIEVARTTTKIKTRAEETMENPSVLINEVLANVSQAEQGSLPCASALKKTIRRKRNQISVPPPDPIDLHQLAIPDEYATYETEPNQKELFLLKDSGPGEDRILLFGRRSWLQQLSSSEVWYCDGTFKIAPKLFSQVYIVLAQKFGGVIPVLYALLPNKQKVTYSRVFEMIKEIEPTVNPKSILCDFELAAFSAIK
ncbi:uncharacterized protein LOC119965989 [Scyliorhinus canicula]|uniref:uncharacterized protein LOC119965989 n=1 Tax=Scyliorhinus canicula TaxID=7830 RepID=UPI0018F2DC7C|nr:uncharacterized protein LOC119965989 [Scyliorhinus canicula]